MPERFSLAGWKAASGRASFSATQANLAEGRVPPARSATSTSWLMFNRMGPAARPAFPKLRHRLCFIGLLAGVALLPAQTSAPPAPVATDPAYHLLDFWLGHWEAVDQATGRVDGHDLIERWLDGAALVENWSDVDGHAGKSWFYYYRPEKRWKQVWVTDAGFVKEKAWVETLPDGGVRFRGEIPLPDGRTVLDQTTLTPLPDGRVHQVIAQSRDGGATWRTAYDALYTRTAPGR